MPTPWSAPRHCGAGAALLLLLPTACDAGDDRSARCEVAAAASLRPLVEDVAAALANAEPPCELRIATGATGSLAAQIRRGAPFTLLLAADETTAQALIAAGHARPADAFRYARGNLVLWTRRDLGRALQQDGMRALEDPTIAHVAIANPEIAPYGRAAMTALERSAVLAAVLPRLVRAENAAQAAHLAHSGAADAALLPASLARQLGGHTWPVPDDQYEPIVHGGLVLARDGAARAQAERVRDFLLSPAGAGVLAAHGLLPPE